MGRSKILLVLIFILATALFSYRATFSFFSNQATSTSNVFTAASTFPTPTPSTNHIVISEVQIDGGPSNADKDFIELYNPTNNPIDLNGHRLVKRTGNGSTDTSIKSFTSSTIIQSHGYYLWANSGVTGYAASIGADTSTGVDLTNSNSIALRNGAENTGTIIDALSWNNGATIGEGTNASIPADNGSLERKALSTSTITSMGSGGTDEFKGNGFDSNNNSTDFILRPTSQPQNSGSATETL